jgi:hypothetical protein
MIIATFCVASKWLFDEGPISTQCWVYMAQYEKVHISLTDLGMAELQVNILVQLLAYSMSNDSFSFLRESRIYI